MASQRPRKPTRGALRPRAVPPPPQLQRGQRVGVYLHASLLPTLAHLLGPDPTFPGHWQIRLASGQVLPVHLADLQIDVTDDPAFDAARQQED